MTILGSLVHCIWLWSKASEHAELGLAEMSITERKTRNPRVLADVLRDLLAVRGYVRSHTLNDLEEAWNQAVGYPDCRQTRVTHVTHGVLNVTVAHSILLEELEAFRKFELLQNLRRTLGIATLRDIKFRIGAMTNLATGPIHSVEHITLGDLVSPRRKTSDIGSLSDPETAVSPK